jgi:hypothetical protein
MEYEIMRVCDAGRRVEKHLRWAGRSRGTLSIQQEHDGIRRRTVLVARLRPGVGQRVIPPLFDVVLIGSTGVRWTLTGVERIEAAPLGREHAVGQTWIVEPAAVPDLMAVELKWSQACGRVHELEQQLLRLNPPKD